MATPFATEAGHWYRVDGTPAYTVIGKNGKERNTTLRDARELGLLPSVTTIIRMAAAPGLENWKQEQVLLAALTLPHKQEETEQEWLARIRADSQEQARKAAERGTAIHGALERHFRGEGATVDLDLWPHVQGAKDCISQNCNGSQWLPERSFAHPAGYGGKCDLHSPEWVIDFKSKEFGPDKPPETYDEHAMQLAAYRRGLDVPAARCGILFVSASVPGYSVLREVDETDLRRGEAMFDSLLSFWRAKTGYAP